MKHAAPLPAEHPDHAIVSPIVDALIGAAGGAQKFSEGIPQILRTAIDEVIDAPRTNRFRLEEIEKTEKTYLGTKIEILLRSFLGLPKGEVLDLSVAGTECDIKTTSGNNWSIPQENIGRLAILVRENDKTARFDFGVGVMRQEYLQAGKNRDRKTGLSSAHKPDIWWIFRDNTYPANFWELLPDATKDQIFAAGKGTARIAKLFELVQGTPISRTQIVAIAQQQDPLRRVRRGGGARDILAPLGIAVLWGEGDRGLIQRLSLGPVLADEFISHRPRDEQEEKLLKEQKHID